MMDGKRCGDKCNGSTTKNAIVCFPPSTYLISSSIPSKSLLSAPFAAYVGIYSSDPDYKCASGLGGCDESWAVMIRESENVMIASAGLYSWFSTYSQGLH